MDRTTLKNKIKKLWHQFRHHLFNAKPQWDGKTLISLQEKSNQAVKFLTKVEYRPHLHRYTLLFMMIITAYSLPRYVGIYLTPLPQIPKGNVPLISLLDHPLNNENSLPQFMQDTEVLKSQDPFKTEAVKEGPAELSKPCEIASGPTTLPLQLMSTVVLQDERKSMAALQANQSPEFSSYRLGEKIENLARVDHIDRLKIIIRNLQNGACESVSNNYFTPLATKMKLMNPDAAAAYQQQMNSLNGIKKEGNTFQVSRAFLTEKLSDLNSILTQARAIPMNNPDGTMSFRIEEVEPGSIFSTLDIASGDVISKINGRPITNLNEVMTMMNQLKTVSSLNLSVLRGGAETTLQYNITE